MSTAANMRGRDIQAILALSAICVGRLVLVNRLRNRRKRRVNWVDLFLKDKEDSDYHLVVNRLRQYGDVKRFKGFLRMSPDLFDEIVARVGPRVGHK